MMIQTKGGGGKKKEDAVEAGTLAEGFAALKNRSGVAWLDPTNLLKRSLSPASPSSVRHQPPDPVAARHLAKFDWLFDNPYTSDLELRIGSGRFNQPRVEGQPDVSEAFASHKCILATHSEAYRAMFEAGNWDEGELRTLDMHYTKETCLCVLRHIYCCEDTLTKENVIEVLDAAVMYHLPILRETTVAFMRAHLSTATVFDYLGAGLLYQESTLKDMCIAFVRRTNAMCDVLYSPQLFTLSKDVLLILVEEAVIDSDVNILTQLHKWCAHLAGQAHESNSSSGSSSTTSSSTSNEGSGSSASTALVPAAIPEAQTLLKEFLRLIDFTAMSAEELQYTESLNIVPVAVLYESFKKRVLAITDGGNKPTIRRGAIHLRWDDLSCSDIVSHETENHLKKSTNDEWETVVALNKFTEGKHYWVYTIHDQKVHHDCLVGVSSERNPKKGDPTAADDPTVMCYDASSDTLTAAGGTVTRHSSPLTDSTTISIGVLVDFNTDTVSFYYHTTKALLCSVRQSPLQTPLYPYVALCYQENGGVSISETTTFLNDSKASNNGMCESCGNSKSPVLSPTSRAWMRSHNAAMKVSAADVAAVLTAGQTQQ